MAKRKNNMCGIVLAGGKGTRLGELTRGISKQLLPVYRHPMVYYPINTLIDMGIKDIMIIVASEMQLELFEEYLGYGERWGVKFSYTIQHEPKGLAHAFTLCEDFIGESDVTLILGDNIFILNERIEAEPNTIFTYKVRNPQDYGVVVKNEFDQIVKIVEKPVEYTSDDAVVGLYVLDNSCVEYAKRLKPSHRGELEIVDLIWEMDRNSPFNVQQLTGVWFDCGNPDDLLECAEHIRSLTKRSHYGILPSLWKQT